METNLFTGVVQENDILAATIFSLDDYVSIFGGTVDDYKDYLLKLHSLLRNVSLDEPVHIVRVPFDYNRFDRWIKQNPQWKDAQEGYGIWALDVAKEPETLASLLAQKPVFPAAPEWERFVVMPLYGITLAAIENEEDFSWLCGRLPEDKLRNVTEKAKQFFSDVPALKPFSRLRCKGISVFVGDRLIPPPALDEAEEHFVEVTEIDTPRPVLPVPRQIRITRSMLDLDLSEGHVLIPVLFPLVIAGADEDVQYCGNLLEENGGLMPDVSNTIFEIFVKKSKRDNPVAVITFAPANLVEHVLEYVDEKIEEGIEELSKTDRVLRRIK